MGSKAEQLTANWCREYMTLSTCPGWKPTCSTSMSPTKGGPRDNLGTRSSGYVCIVIDHLAIDIRQYSQNLRL